MLWLALFSQAEHFQSIRRKRNGDSGAAEVEDRLAIPHAKDTSEAARVARGENVKTVPACGDDRVNQVLASLPPNHGISTLQASNILARVKGDLGEAIDVLLEQIDLDKEGDGHVDDMLASRATSPAISTASDKTSTDEDLISGTSKVTTPSMGSTEMDKSMDLRELG